VARDALSLNEHNIYRDYNNSGFNRLMALAVALLLSIASCDDIPLLSIQYEIVSGDVVSLIS
jgi:hypothetical protein